MDLRQLEYVVAVADEGGFTSAARAVHVAQPSLSQSVRTLERELGTDLFHRLGRAVQLTPAGELVVVAARRVLADMATVRAAAASAAALDEGHLDLVALPTLAVDPLAALIGRYRRRHPGMTVRVLEPEDGGELDRLVASGRAEVGLTDLTVGGEGLRRVPLFRQAVLLVGAAGALAAGPVRAAALARLPLIATPPGTSTRRLLDQALERAGAPATIAVEIAQREAILPLVLAGAGVALLPEPQAREAGRRGGDVREVQPAISRRIGLLHRTGPLSPGAAAFVELARSAQRG